VGVIGYCSTFELSFGDLVYKLLRPDYGTDALRKARACAKRLGVRRLDAAFALLEHTEIRREK
jgi:hypothetical protein